MAGNVADAIAAITDPLGGVELDLPMRSSVRIMDGLIAGIVRANGLILATRDVRDFADCGLDVINPWGD